MKPLSLLALPLAAVALTACGSSSKSSSTSSSAPAPAASSSSSTATASTAPATGSEAVTMKNLAFSPATIHAKVGQTITFTNADTPPHNVTYVSGPKFSSSSTMNPGAKFSLKLTQAGTIHYFCSIHPFMKGTIVVVAG